MGEQKHERVDMGCRIFWDQKTDTYTKISRSFDHIFCAVAVFATYHY